jgi:hypothetical protein
MPANDDSGCGPIGDLLAAWFAADTMPSATSLVNMASLFGRNTVRERAALIPTDEIAGHLEIVQAWYDDYVHGTLKQDKETSREQGYNQDFFIKILGYQEKRYGLPHTLEPKATTQQKQFPDVLLSYTDSDKSIENIAAVVELKDASTSLDRPQQREGNLTPVQQGFKYKTQYRSCPFVVVSNFFEFRLYNDNQLDYERWTLADLVDPADGYLKFKTWYYIMRADNFTSAHGKSGTELLLSDIRQEQEDLSKEFYADYKSTRLELLQDIWVSHPNTRRQFGLAIQKAQTIIDRIVFACFAEDRGLLPDNIVARVVEYSDRSPYNEPLFHHFKNFFTAIDKGSERLGIPDGYNGGLFAEDPWINALQISDGPLRNLADINRYDFQQDLSVNILGHIFEQSITDLEEIKRLVWEEQHPWEPPLPEPEVGRRKREGVYYTADYIVRYIVDNTVGAYLRDAEDAIRKNHGLSGRLGEKGYEERERKAYLEYQHVLQNIKVCDPACGSGAFLVHVFDYLLAENQRVDTILGGSLTSMDEYVRNILHNNIFGVDVNEESVEITKLSLWLKTAQKGKKLTALDANIRVGNSVVDDPNIVGDKAFRWEEQFPEIMKAGGFDAVVMNPPYVDSEEMVRSIPEERQHMAQVFDSTKGNWDLYIAFIDRARGLTKPTGYTGFITPDKWLSKDFGTAARQNIFSNLMSIANAGRGVFQDSGVDAIVTVIKGASIDELGIGYLSDVGVDRVGTFPKKAFKQPYRFDHLFHPESSLIMKIDTKPRTLSEYAECESACSTSDAYKLKPYIEESGDPSDGYLMMVNTGTLDRFTTRWGIAPMTYLGDKYLHPVVSVKKFKSDFGNAYYAKSIRPKLIIKGLTLLDVAIDPNAEFLPGKTTLVIPCEDTETLKFLAAFLNSRLPIFYIKRKYSSASYNGGITFSKEMINTFPVPRIPRAVRQRLADVADEIIVAKQELSVVDGEFVQLVKQHFAIKSWPKKLAQWWLLDFDGFVAPLKKLTLSQKAELLAFWNAKHGDVQKAAHRLAELENQIDDVIFDWYGLTPDEISVVLEG